GPAATPRAGGPDVLIVDRADRLTTRQLAALVAAAAQEAQKVVLVEGGTLSPARQPLSVGFAGLAGQVPPLDLLPPGRMIAAAVDRWFRGQAAGQETVLVGLGPAEVGALNAAARDRLVRAGTVEGPAMEAYGRTFQAGDRILALRQGAGHSGAVGT